ncbi:aspartic proteinase CDR1-like isoform X2 [Vicia villosa]|uniref:aspartic proteinase CDR1-like isoform X2 n=1 Tax=Vicia villosa TaxID=3911 RepID=UPI00273A7C06|nr:aspartic proteinase CDR1-like isoform X2 [Vicia villosa]XP_058780386.1 aspartic proteinase CDR1-like isoform X2 [Vicia villosa]XP_058780387.1 aspartic proteinase CDR1-like isoform X2 [Vicia villosa]XP_058780389.1 aspartic proteinase CDR1-like isoform X2 [Vicia villosa]XP_058780390.1 aspartic proteinase CDR1-like isoform X2 [Vicia villosa]XP_058780391.1 aspartic proteinase CDR1-like isoform X2 [Vicia villosa]XP_058780392.1 aspartic proteinase CDR1-like isoform X2 [Vicia villosa]XP_05878039
MRLQDQPLGHLRWGDSDLNNFLRMVFYHLLLWLDFLWLLQYLHLCQRVISHGVTNGFRVELIHRDSSKSPFYNPTQTKFQRSFNALYRSINRANYFYKVLFSTKNKLESYMPYDNVEGEYLISYSIGTPPFKVYGILDTGSNLIWLQCEPCNTCYNQTSLIFNPSKSSSYKNISCSSRTCKSMEDTSCSYDGDVCQYTLDYGHGINTHGDLSVETLALDSTTGSFVSFPKIVIGCGHNNGDPMNNGPNSGVIGFGSGNTSIIKQLGSSIGGRFSYCLIDQYNSKSIRSSKLNFGDEAIVTGDNVVSTPIVKMIGNRQKDYYYLTVKAFSVGNKRIEYRGFKREGTNASTHEIIIDSGTTVSILPYHFYYRMESAVKKVVKLERFQVHADPSSLCYNTTFKQYSFPPITVHFKGADVKLDSKGSFYSLYEGVECFAFQPYKNGLGIFGNLAQVNYLVGYDLNKNIVSFKPTDCASH